MGLLRKRPETVLKSTYETAILERDAFEKEVKKLQQQVSVLVINEDVMRRLALRAITLLGKVDTKRSGGVALQKEIDTLVAEVRSAGVIGEKGAGHVAENPASVETTPGQARTETHD